MFWQCRRTRWRVIIRRWFRGHIWSGPNQRRRINCSTSCLLLLSTHDVFSQRSTIVVMWHDTVHIWIRVEYESVKVLSDCPRQDWRCSIQKGDIESSKSVALYLSEVMVNICCLVQVWIERVCLLFLLFCADLQRAAHWINLMTPQA